MKLDGGLGRRVYLGATQTAEKKWALGERGLGTLFLLASFRTYRHSTGPATLGRRRTTEVVDAQLGPSRHRRGIGGVAEVRGNSLEAKYFWTESR